MKVNNIYSTMQGEVNPFGIGCPVIFLRLQGCHIRCYKRTLGNLCDTIEALSKPVGKTEINSIFAEVEKVSQNTGIKLITLSGGDPLWNDSEELKELFKGLTSRGFTVCVETSGTISWLPYMRNGVHWILDYKLKSAGITNGTTLFEQENHLKSLKKTDFIKFVIYDLEDLQECVRVINKIKDKTKATLSIGAYWGGKLDTFQIFELVKKHKGKLLGRVTINMQTHKMAVSSDFTKNIPTDV